MIALRFLLRLLRLRRKGPQPPPTIAPLGQRTNSHRAALELRDKLNFNGHGRSSIFYGGLDARHDADHRSRLCPARPGKCAPSGPNQSSAAEQSPGRSTHRPAIRRPAAAGSITATTRPAVLLE